MLTLVTKNQAELFVKIIRELTLGNLADKSDIQEINFKLAKNAADIEDLKESNKKIEFKLDQMDNRLGRVEQGLTSIKTEMVMLQRFILVVGIAGLLAAIKYIFI